MHSIRKILAGQRGRYPRINLAIAVFCLGLLAVLWAGTTQRIRFEHDEAIANAIRENSNLAMAFEEQTVRTLKAAEQVALFVRHEYARQGRDLDLPAYIRSGVLNEWIFTIISIVDEHGDIVKSSRETGRVNYADRDFFTFHRQRRTEELYISKPVLGRVSHTWQVPMAIPLNGPQGAFAGVVVLSLDPAFFTQFYQKADLGNEGAVALVGLDGVIRARQVGTRTSYGQDVGESELFLQRARNPVGSYVGPDALDGVRRVFSYRSFQDYPLVAMVGTAEAEVLAPFYERRRNYYFVAILATAFILASALFLMTALSRQRRAEERLAHQAHHDGLTNLPNRILCYDRLERSLIRARRRNCQVGFLFVDLDGFKQINDSLGHACGDELLRQVAARLRQSLRVEDTVGRLGGDEFAIVLPEIAAESDCALVAQKVVEALAQPYRLDRHEVRISASIGIATYPKDGNDADTLVMKADSAMFRAKKAGKNNYRFHGTDAAEPEQRYSS